MVKLLHTRPLKNMLVIQCLAMFSVSCDFRHRANKKLLRLVGPEMHFNSVKWQS